MTRLCSGDSGECQDVAGDDGVDDDDQLGVFLS